MTMRAGGWISSINTSIPQTQPSLYFPPRATNNIKGNNFPLIRKRSKKGLVTISSSDGRWHGEWNSDYIFTLRDLQLEDLPEDGQTDTQVEIKLYIHKHTGFGLSVDGRIMTCFTRKCSNCSSPYCREIVASFKVWALPTSREKGCTDELPLLGWDDPSVIYVKPGFEADLDSLIQDTIRLAISEKRLVQNHVRNLNLNYSLWVNKMLLPLIGDGPDYWRSTRKLYFHEISIPIQGHHYKKKQYIKHIIFSFCSKFYVRIY